jgi:hypothetical protein
VERQEPGISGGIGTAPEGYMGHVTFYVGMPSFERALETIERLGPRIALFEDPDGRVAGLVEV